VPPSLFEIVFVKQNIARCSLVPLERDVETLLLRVTAAFPLDLHVGERDDGVVRAVCSCSGARRTSDAAVVLEEVLLLAFRIAFVEDLDRDAGVQERELAQALRQRVEVVARDGEDLRSA